MSVGLFPNYQALLLTTLDLVPLHDSPLVASNCVAESSTVAPLLPGLGEQAALTFGRRPQIHRWERGGECVATARTSPVIHCLMLSAQLILGRLAAFPAFPDSNPKSIQENPHDRLNPPPRTDDVLTSPGTPPEPPIGGRTPDARLQPCHVFRTASKSSSPGPHST